VDPLCLALSKSAVVGYVCSLALFFGLSRTFLDGSRLQRGRLARSREGAKGLTADDRSQNLPFMLGLRWGNHCSGKSRGGGRSDLWGRATGQRAFA